MAGCNNESSTDAGTDAGHLVAVNFSVDDTINKTFTATDAGYSDLRWKGAMIYDRATGRITYDTNWGGSAADPFAPLYDDGPWTATGHEPAGSTAGDHIWGITVFVVPPAVGSQDFDYGTIDFSTGGWLWRGTNGKFTVHADDVDPITATGLALLQFGKTNLKIVLDTGALAPKALPDGGPATLPDGGIDTWDTSKIYAKGGAWGWQFATMYDDGTHGDSTPNDHKYSFLLSTAVGPGTITPHSGLLASGDQPQFVIALGAASDDNMYRSGGAPSSTAVTAYLGLADGGFAPAAITHVDDQYHNCVVTVP
jgi:hypothetical protein